MTVSESPAQSNKRHRSKSPSKKTSPSRSNQQSRSPAKSPLRILRDESLRLDTGGSEVTTAASAQLASEFYNVTNVKHIPSVVGDLKPPLATQSQTLASPNPPLQHSRVTDDVENETIKKQSGARRKSLGSSSLEFLTSFFTGGSKSKSQSPSRSKTPPPPSTSNVKQQQKQSSVLNALVNPPPVPVPSTTNYASLGSSDTFNVQDMIRNELKKIVQMQHDTVMGFLNGGLPQNSSPTNFSMPVITSNKSHLEQQLTSILRQQQQSDNGSGPTTQPVEFIIETKIKTIHPKTGQPMISSTEMSSLKNAHSETNHFMKTFHSSSPPPHEQEKNSRTHHNIKQRRSSRIKIPLLNLNQPLGLDVAPSSTFTINTNLPLLDFKSKKTSSKHKDETKHLLTLDGIDGRDKKNKLNKHVKEFIQANKSSAMANYKQFPLLKLNYAEDRMRLEASGKSFSLLEYFLFRI